MPFDDVDTSWSIPPALREAVDGASARWHAEELVGRLWARDAGVWTGGDEGRWLAWLEAPERERANLAALRGLAADVRAGGFRDALLLGMGGSSLGPEVLETVFGAAPGHPC